MSRLTKLYEGKKKKRALEEKNISTILKHNAKGCVVCLSGPAIEVHAEALAPLLKAKSELLFVEIDEDLAKSENMGKRTKKIGDSRVTFRTGNVWDVVRGKYLYRNGWKGKHVLFDLDFCETAESLIAKGLLKELRLLAQSKLPRRSGFWLSLTVCQRGDINSEWIVLPSKMIDIFHKAKWSIRPDSRINPYKDGNRGSPMLNFLFHFRYDYNRKTGENI